MKDIISIITLAILLQACGSDIPTIAYVGDREILQTEFDAYLKHKRINNDETLKGNVLQEYLKREALAQAIKKQQLVDQDLLEAQVNEFRKQVLISNYFVEYLKEKVPDQALSNYYASNEEEFSTKKVHVAHILIRTNSKMSDNERQALLTQAHSARSRLITGSSFEEIALQVSDDKQSAKKGGDIGWIKEGALSTEFSQQVFAMKPGEISEPITTSYGFHIVKFIEGPSVIKQPFEKVKGYYSI